MLARTLFLLVAAACAAAGCTGAVATDKTTSSTYDTGTDVSDTGDATTDTTDTVVTTPTDPDGDGDGSPASVDCDDTDPTVFPGAREVCDGQDNDCDDEVDDQAAATFDGQNHETVAEALDAALALDAPAGAVTICAAEDPWELEAGREVGVGQALIVRGTGAPAATVLQSAGGFFRVAGSLTLEHLTLTGATGEEGTVPIDAVDESTLTLSHVVITENQATGLRISGRFDGVVASLTGVEVSNNSASGDGGGIAASQVFDLVLSGSVVSGNTAANGGGIHATAGGGLGRVALAESRVENNVATQRGGGLFIARAPAGTPSLELTTTVIEGNEALVDGGGIHAVEVHVEGDDLSEILGNLAGTQGGGLSLAYADATGLAVRNNQCDGSGGGIATSAANSAIILERIALDGNEAESGGALYVGSNASVELREGSVTNNEVGETGLGGGALVDVGTGASLTSVDQDWGVPGVDDNVPSDIHLLGPDLSYLYDGSSVSSFTCGDTTGTCE